MREIDASIFYLHRDGDLQDRWGAGSAWWPSRVALAPRLYRPCSEASTGGRRGSEKANKKSTTIRSISRTGAPPSCEAVRERRFVAATGCHSSPPLPSCMGGGSAAPFTALTLGDALGLFPFRPAPFTCTCAAATTTEEEEEVVEVVGAGTAEAAEVVGAAVGAAAEEASRGAGAVSDAGRARGGGGRNSFQLPRFRTRVPLGCNSTTPLSPRALVTMELKHR